MRTFKLFTTQSCPKCPEVKEFVKESGIQVEMVDAGSAEGLTQAREYNVTAVPTFIVFEDGKEIGRARSVHEIEQYI